MSRPASRATPLIPAAVALVVIALLLLMVTLGKGGDDGAAPTNTEATPTATFQTDLPDLEEGFVAIAGSELFATVAAAQRAAGSWEVSSVATLAEGNLPTAMQQIELDGDQTRFRMLMEVQGQAVEGRWIDEIFYLKGLNPKKWVPWYQMPDNDTTRNYLASLLEASAADSLSRLGEPASYEVVGLEDVTELDDDPVRAVHYKVGIDPTALEGGQESSAVPPSLTIDMWVDAENRPVQVQSTLVSQGQEFTTTLFFSGYGTDFGLVAPPAKQVTEKVPPAMKG